MESETADEPQRHPNGRIYVRKPADEVCSVEMKLRLTPPMYARLVEDTGGNPKRVASEIRRIIAEAHDGG